MERGRLKREGRGVRDLEREGVREIKPGVKI